MNRKIAFGIAIVVLILVGIAGVTHFAPTPVLPAPTERTFTLVLRDNALESGPALMTANQGDTVILRVKSNQEGHLMVHGYEKDLAINADGETSLTFVAEKSGRFFLHIHKGEEHIPVAEIQIQPR